VYKPSLSHQKFLDILTEKNRPKKVASLMDEYLGDQKEYQKAVDDGFQGTYEEFLRMKSLERKELAIGGGVIQGKDYGTREGFLRPKKTKAKNLSKVKNYLDEETFVKLRKENKNLTNNQFAKYLNEDTNYIPDPKQAKKFKGISIDRRFNAAKAKNLFPKTFTYAGSDKDRLITDKDRREYLKYAKKRYKNNPEKYQKLLSLDNKQLNSKISNRRKFLKLMLDDEKRDAKNIRAKKYRADTTSGARGEEAKQKYEEYVSEKNRLAKKNRNLFYRNVKDGKSLLWEDMLKRSQTYKDPYFKINKKFTEGQAVDKKTTEKLILTDKKGNKYKFNTLLEDINKAQDIPAEEVIKPYNQKAFLFKEKLMPKIMENYGFEMGSRKNPIHIQHVEGFNKNPFNVQLTFADQNLNEGKAKISLESTFKNILKREKPTTLGGVLNYNKKKNAIQKFYNSLGPDIATKIGKKEVGTRTPLIDIIKKSGVKMSPKLKKRASELGYVDADFLKDVGKGAGKLLTAAGTPLGVLGLTAGFGVDPTSAVDRATVGLEAALAPTLVKGTNQLTKNALLRKLFNLGLSPQAAIRAARIASPLGIASLGGEALYQYGKFAKNEIEKVRAMEDEERKAYNEDLMDEGGLLD
jgi:hypothetical protein